MTEPRYILDVKTLEMLVCPLTKTRLTLSADKSELISIAGRLAFPIIKGVPLLSLEEARPVEPDELKRLPELQARMPDRNL
ncbi:Trm112 family protein [Devosia sp.]|uniref:Trm112 family protein n=1 Tax=Devosia sp. TaxID=1871048 RepID=UPI0032656D16